jgi:hypothetical protein
MSASAAHAGTFGGCGLYLITFILCYNGGNSFKNKYISGIKLD